MEGGKSLVVCMNPSMGGVLQKKMLVEERLWLSDGVPAGAKCKLASQDLFLSGALKSATDFQVYKEVAGLSGLDFAYVDSTAVYHMKNDKLKLLKSGSLQHLGENMLAFPCQTAASSLSLDGRLPKAEGDGDQSVFFDILCSYMVISGWQACFITQ